MASADAAVKDEELRHVLFVVQEEIKALVENKSDGLTADECCDLRTFAWTLADPLRGKKKTPILPVRKPLFGVAVHALPCGVSGAPSTFGLG